MITIVDIGVWAVLFWLFAGSQALYFVINLMAAVLLFPRAVNSVDTDREPRQLRPIHVLIPIYKEHRSVVTTTLRRLEQMDYPPSYIRVYVIHESPELDPTVNRHIDELAAHTSLPVKTVMVDREHQISWNILSTLSMESLPRNKAFALQYALHELDIPAGDVITVFDADTIVPPDLFRLGVAGLEEYDIVQAKQTVRNLGDGWLPLLEAMGMAAWSHIIYPHTTKGPYQLLGKGYFMEAGTLYDLEGWDPEHHTEDLALGIQASMRGYRLGVVDRYIQDLCPATLTDWVAQKQRWLAGPYRVIHDAEFTPLEMARFVTYTVANQIMSLNNVVGVPAGLFVAWLVVTTSWAALPTWLVAVSTFNLAHWTYYTVRSYAALRDAIHFPNTGLQSLYLFLSNPITQAVYATVWVLPLAQAWKHLVLDEDTGFFVTPKQPADIRTEPATPVPPRVAETR